MNTDKHGLKKSSVVLKKIEYRVVRESVPISENQWLIEKIKYVLGRGSVYFSVNQWLIKKENKFGMGSWVIRVYQWLIREKMGGFPRFKDINFTLDKEKDIPIILNIENT